MLGKCTWQPEGLCLHPTCELWSIHRAHRGHARQGPQKQSPPQVPPLDSRLPDGDDASGFKAG